MNMTPVAQAVQRQGRGDDTMLVHMTPGEVGGLQALAMAHGGSLSINPNTGLPEAGFLKNILPTLLGVGLSFIPGVGPLAAGLTVGGIETVRTGDIGKGFLAGLGAFGGANLAGSLAQTGAATAASAAPGVSEAVASGALPQTAASFAPSAAPTVGQTALQASFPAAGTSAGGSLLAANPMTAATTMGATLPTGYSAMGEGFRALGTEAGRDAFMSNIGGYTGLAKQAGMAAAPALLAQPEAKPIEPEKSTYEGPYVPTPREVRFPTADQRRDLGTSEFQYFTDVNPVPGFQPFSATQSAQAAPTTLPSTSSNLLTGQREEDLIPEGQLGSGLQRFMAPGGGFDRFAQSRISSITGPSSYGRFATGGVPTLEDGGFVLTKKAVDGLGRGSNKRGQQVASAGLGAIPIKGAGAKRGPKAGVDDKIKTTIDGKRPALVSNGEAYVPKKQVAKKGGAKAFYALMNKAEKAAEKRKRA